MNLELADRPIVLFQYVFKFGLLVSRQREGALAPGSRLLIFERAQRHLIDCIN
jgi:hypothetical protein